MALTRRQLLLRALFGPGLVGLRSMATGIPIPLLLAPERAQAANKTALKPQFLLFCTSSNGDPVNANVPGTYDDPGVFHASHPSMASTPITVGTTTSRAAQVWTGLPSSMLANTCFFHHASGVNAHPDETRMLKLRDGIKNSEMLPSLLARSLAEQTGSVRSVPINFNTYAIESITAQGSLQPSFTPKGLADMLSVPSDGLGNANFVALRDQTIDSLHAWAKTRGAAFQAALIDQYALSQNQVRTMQQRVVSQLSAITGNDSASQIKAALVLFQMNVAPVAMMRLDFGGDNHTDVGSGGAVLANEVNAHQTAIALLATLPASIAAAGLTDQVTFCMSNVFGRTLSSYYNSQGRDHNQNHTVGLLYGPQVQGGIVGGLQASGRDFAAAPIDAKTGLASASGDIALSDSASSFGKTLAAVTGLPASIYDVQITAGTAVAAAVKGS